MTAEDDPYRTTPDLDDLLARTAPPVSATSPQVQRRLGLLMRSVPEGTLPPRASADARRGRRRRIVGAGVAVVAFAGVSTAAASPSAPSWLGWADWLPDREVAEPPGHCALLGIKVVPEGAGVDDPGVVAAREYLAGLDLADVDITDELAEQRSTVVTRVDGTQTTGAEFYSDEQLEYFAYTAAVNDMIFSAVRRQGLDPSHVSIEGRAEGCDEVAGQ